mmetsp:Transcript_31770/g.81378  ORF Transcript_31770/g.81378 Transcript_31770/m.81378 type:complete len:256 (+) Transcript_31770:522-1289(+)
MNCGSRLKDCERLKDSGTSFWKSPKRAARRMSVRSSQRSTSKASSLSDLKVARRAMTTAAHSWSKDSPSSGALSSTQVRPTVTTRMRRCPLEWKYVVWYCMKKGRPGCSGLACGLFTTSKKKATEVVWSSMLSFHADVWPMPTSSSLTCGLGRPRLARGPMAPQTLFSREQSTSMLAPKHMSRLSCSSRANMRCSDLRNTSWLRVTSPSNVSDSRMSPPVCTMAGRISATPTWSSAHANTSSAKLWLTMRSASAS